MDNLKCMFWNIHGIHSKTLGNKTSNPDFLNIIQDYDIIGLGELHTETYLNIPGFTVKKQKIRPKKHKGPKIAGGIAVLIKNHLAD